MLAGGFGVTFLTMKLSLVEALEAAFALGDEARDARSCSTGSRRSGRESARTLLEAHAHRFRAKLTGDEAGYRAAAALFRERSLEFWLAVTLLEHGEAVGSGVAPRRGARDLRAARGDAVARARGRRRGGGRRVTCGSCGTENRPGRKFCSACGAPLALGCPACGAANDPGDAFCGECGSALGEAGAPAVARAAPAAERKLVSVLFADLVGFTALSESRDAEDTRELLSRYFETCRRLIELYGGTVEKFIGDAVMAVWGTPTTTEDDAERAVRAALDLVAAVSALGDEVGASELRARAGVLTGEAAVTIGAEGQGMVAGDLVNTASRIQSAAEPGTVLVGEATRRATEQTVAYEDAGAHELKGQGGADAALACAPGRLRGTRHAQVRRARGSVRRP